MDRRSFLWGGLFGVSAGAAISHVAQRATRESSVASVLDDPGEDPGENSGDATKGEDPAAVPAPPALGPQPPDGRQVSYAQQGEDLIVRHALSTLGIDRPTYVDVGAFHPTISSNTYLLYLDGGHGVLVEPNPTMVSLLERARPRDRVVMAGIGVDDHTEADYYMIRDRPQLNTFSKAQVDRYVAQRGPSIVAEVRKMPLRRLSEVIDQELGRAPDYLSIDVEGMDLDILRTLDLESMRPAVICVEAGVYDTLALVPELIDELRAHRYAVRGGSLVNAVFVDEDRVRGRSEHVDTARWSF